MQAGWQLRPNIASPLAPPHASDHVAPLFSRPQLVGHYHVTSSLARLLRLLTNSLTDSHLPNWRFLEKGKTFKNFSWLWIWLGRLVQFSWGGKRQHKVCTGAWNARIMKRVRQEGIFQFWPAFNLAGDLCQLVGYTAAAGWPNIKSLFGLWGWGIERGTHPNG